MREIFRIKVGSVLYGLNHSGSDEDVKAVALPSDADLLGLNDTARQHWTQSEPSDTQVYSIAKFFNLLTKCNPTVLELLGVIPQDAIIIQEPEWNDIRNFCCQTFITKKILPSFFGYVTDQYKRVEARKAQNNRTEMIEKHGYDVKSASHVYRIVIQAMEWMTDGMACPRMTGRNREVAFDIKMGKYSYDETLKILQSVMNSMKEAESNCKLPEEPNMEAATHFIVDLHRRVILESRETIV